MACGLLKSAVSNSPMWIRNLVTSIRRLKESLHTITAAVATSRTAVARRDGCLRARLRKPRADGSDYLLTHQKGASSSFATFRRLPQALASRSRSAISRVLKHSLAAHLVAGKANLALIRQALEHRPNYTAYLILVGTLFCLGSRPHGAVLAGLVGAGRNITSGIASSRCCVHWNQ